MSVLWDKDWRYKVSLDKSKLDEVTKFAKSIKNKEVSKVMLNEISFFKKYFSIEQVISIIQTLSDNEFDTFSKTIKNNLVNLLYIPEELEDYYKSIIKKCPSNHQELLTFLLNLGRKNHVYAPYKTYYKLVLGKFYSKVLEKCKKYASNYKHNIKPIILNEYEISNSLDNLKKKIDASPAVLSLWGKNHNMDFFLKYNNTYGFGKFRSSVTTELPNTLTINCPEHKIEEDELHMQYLTNVYPGYGHFVETQFSDIKSRNIDFGANFIFNGWSTFSAWHIFPSFYTKNLKIINAKIIKLLFEKPSQKLYTQIYHLLINTYDKSIAIKILKQISQSIGKFESRFLGAMATEIIIDKGYAMNPINYLERLKKVDITNYFTPLKKIK